MSPETRTSTRAHRSPTIAPRARRLRRGLQSYDHRPIDLRPELRCPRGHVTAETESENDDGIAETARKIDRGVTDIAQRFGCQAPQVVGICSPECVLGESRDEHIVTAGVECGSELAKLTRRVC